MTERGVWEPPSPQRGTLGAGRMRQFLCCRDEFVGRTRLALATSGAITSMLWIGLILASHRELMAYLMWAFED